MGGGGALRCVGLCGRRQPGQLRLKRCWSVCLLARLLKNARMDLNEIFFVDRCLDVDKPINF